MTVIDHYLYFYTPCLSTRDIRIALQFVAQCGARTEALFAFLKTHRRTFDDYPALEKALRHYYGFEKKEVKKAGEKESIQTEVKRALFRESAFKGLDFKEKKAVIKIEKLFQGRYIKND